MARWALFFVNRSKHTWDTWFLGRFVEEHVDDCVTIRDELGPILCCKTTLLANDQSLGQLIVGHQACAISTVAMVFRWKGECRKLLLESSKPVSGSRCGGASMLTQGAEFARFWRKKAPILAHYTRRWNQAAGPISATICSVLDTGLEAKHTRFLASARRQCHS